MHLQEIWQSPATHVRHAEHEERKKERRKEEEGRETKG